MHTHKVQAIYWPPRRAHQPLNLRQRNLERSWTSSVRLLRVPRLSGAALSRTSCCVSVRLFRSFFVWIAVNHSAPIAQRRREGDCLRTQSIGTNESRRLVERETPIHPRVSLWDTRFIAEFGDNCRFHDPRMLVMVCIHTVLRLTCAVLLMRPPCF